MARYLVIANKTGQLGNRLVVWAHMLAAGLERGWTVLNPSFDEYAPDFTGSANAWMSAGGDRGSPPPRWGRRALYWANRFGYKLAVGLHHVPGTPVAWVKSTNTYHYDLGGMLDRADAKGWRMIFTQNYHFREHTWVVRHAPRIRELLTPIATHRQAAEATMASARRGADLVVGVHVRHGDYRHHRGGEFYYEPPIYRSLMQSVVALHPGRRVRFLVCSNGSVGPADFAGLETLPGPGGVVSDLHALSLCDAIMGPPSSFSAWAAFHGERPYWMIEKPLPATPTSFVPQPSPDPKY